MLHIAFIYEHLYNVLAYGGIAYDYCYKVASAYCRSRYYTLLWTSGAAKIGGTCGLVEIGQDSCFRYICNSLAFVSGATGMNRDDNVTHTGCVTTETVCVLDLPKKELAFSKLKFPDDQDNIPIHGRNFFEKVAEKVLQKRNVSL